MTTPFRLSPFIAVLCLVLAGQSHLYAQETACGDGVDNDGDGLIDCYDGDCQGVNGCEDFFFNPPEPDCGFTPPELEEIELNLLYQTDEVNFPIDQRSGVFVGDMNGDGIPDLVTRDNSPARIQIYSGDDGRNLQSIVTPRTHPFGQVAIADVDADGLGDVFQIEYTGVLARYEFGNPNAVWRSNNNIGDDNNVSTPQLADINQDGIPEVYVGDRIFNALTGERYTDGGNNVNVGGYAGGNNSDRFPVYFDLYQPGDPRPDGTGNFNQEAAGMEYIAGNQVWTVTFDPAGGVDNGSFQLAAEYSGPSNLRDGLTSIADINGDGRMDVAVMDAGDVYAWDPYRNEIIGAGYQVPDTGSGGRINIGDFDGDGDVELGFAGRNIYVVRNYVDNDGDNNPNNGTWSTLWQKTGLDDGSQRTGSTLFDFDGNGTVEVVYSEEENLFIYDGPTGNELFRITSRSGTRTEYPLVADVNGDGTAEIIVTAQDRNGPQFSGNGWVSVYESANQPWVPARQVWNQHGYNVTNVNDDLTIPQFQQDNLNPALGQRYNNYLVQTAVGGDSSAIVVYPAPDAIIGPVLDGNGLPVIDFSDCPNTITISLFVENAGSAPLPASTPISFYDGDPSAVAANLITTTILGEQVEAGDTETVLVTINVASVPAGSPIWLSVNDPGFLPVDLPFDDDDFPLTGTAECDYTNNVSNVGNVRCGEVCNNGIDDDGDGIVDEPNVVQFVDTGCPGDVLPAITADVAGGTWSVVGGSSIGTTVDQNGVVTLGNNFTGVPVTEIIRYDDGICVADAMVTTIDDVAPAVLCPGDALVAVDANCVVALADYAANVQTSDNCTASNLITISQSPTPGSSLILGANAVIITVTDQSGNASNCAFTVTAEDRIDPTVSCPTDAEVMVDANCQFEVPDLTGGAVVSDNCSTGAGISLAQTPVQGQLFSNDGTAVLVTLTATDEAGNVANCTYTLTLDDETPPGITCPATVTRELSANDCTLSIPDFTGQAGLTDNCSANNQITVSQSPAPGSTITEPTTTMVTLTATDADGNMADCSFNLITEDLTPPVVNCPGEQLVNADPINCAGTVTDVTGLISIADNCGATGITVAQSPAAGFTFTATTQNVTITTTDASGNSSQCTVTFRKEDVTAPVLNCPGPQTITVDANSCLVALPNFTVGAGSDACGGVSVTQMPGPGTNVSNDLTVTLTAVDNAGLTTTCTIEVTVEDTTPPEITCPATQTIAVDGTCEVPLPDYTGQASIDDNCDPLKGPITVTQSPGPNAMYDINDSPVTVTLTATDASGNPATCSFQVQLLDNQPPMISCPVSPQLDQLDNNCNAELPDFRSQVMVSSTCSMSGFTLTQAPPPGTTVNGEQIVAVTITADDGQGNTVSCSFDYQTIDVSAPSIFCPADQTEEVNGDCEFIIPDYTGQAAVTDNCSTLAPAPAPNVTLTQSPAAGTVVSGAGTVTQIMLTATDAAGNTSSCSFDLTLEDATPPAITCPINQTDVVDNACNFNVGDYTGLASATDNCALPGTITISQFPLPNTVVFSSPNGITLILSATDEAGNSADCSFTLTVTDNQSPTITCPPNPTLAVDDACMVTVPDLTTDATTDDNCLSSTPLSVTQDVAAGTILSGDGTTQPVVLTVTDAAGLTANCTVTITLDDVTEPTVICPANQDVNLDATGCQVALPDFSGQLTLADNCTSPIALTVQQMPAQGTIVTGANTVETVTFDVNDGNGNSATCTFEVTLKDATDPTVVCPTPPVLALDENCSVLLPDYTSLATATDDCAMSNAITLTQSPAAGTGLTFDGAQTTVTITADDGHGNASGCSFTVMAEDMEAPAIVCPLSRDVPVSAGCEFMLPDYTVEAAVMDNCSEAAAITVTQSPAAGTILPEAQLDLPQVITLTATDAAGNMEVCTFEITPVDETPPGIICPPQQTIQLDAAACEVMLGDLTGLATVTDNCTDPAMIVVTQDIAAAMVYTGLVPGRVDVTLTAEDASGNTADCTLEVLIVDSIDPTVNCSAANQTIALDENCNGQLPDLIPDLVTGDNCSATALTILQSPVAGSDFNGDGTMVDVMFTVSDPSGNSVTCMATVTFEDQSPPNPVICPVDQELNVDDTCPVPLPDYTGGVTVVDNCRAQEDIVVTQSPAPGTMVMLSDNVVPITLTADDGNGNTATCSFDVTLVDESELDITCPGGQIVIASSDDCDGEFDDYTALVLANNLCMQPAAGVTFIQNPAPGTLLTQADLDNPQTVTITALDLAGNPAMCTFEVTLVDTLAPVLTCPADVTRSVDETTCVYFTDDYRTMAMVDDNCAATSEVVVTQSPLPGAPLAGPNATESITITAVDPSGNQSQCSFVLTIVDSIPPTVSCPLPDTLLTNANCEVTIGDYTGQALVNDNCTLEENITVTQSPPAGTVISGHLMTQVVTITATDGSGNSESCDFMVTAKDETPPMVFCQPDQVIHPDANCEALIPDYRGGARVVDNCATEGNITITQRPAPGTLLSGQGDVTDITLIADDGNGNRDSCTFRLTLEDNTPPAISCPADAVINVDADCNYDLADLTGEADVLDNCTAASDIIVTQNIGVGQTFSGHLTEVVVTLTADDRNGNTAQCTTTITLNDATPPSITCPENQEIFVDQGCSAIVPDYRQAIVDDNCTTPAAIMVTQVPAPGTTFTGDSFTGSITLTADDGNGNTTSCTFDLTLRDNTPPVVSCPPAQEIFVDGACGTTLPDYLGQTTVSDNCNASPVITQSSAPGSSIAGLGSETVTMTANDGNGNTASCSFVVTISDNTPPELICPAVSTITADAGCSFELADYRDSIMVSDNCGPTSIEAGALTLVQSPPTGATVTGLGAEQVVAITATDPSGNSAMCMITVMLEDNSPPTIDCLADTTLAVDATCAALVPDYTDLPMVADNCETTGTVVVTQSPVPGTMVADEASIVMITLTATDASGNTASCDFAVQLIDSIAPMVACPADDVISVDGNCDVMLPDYRPNAGPTDNCSEPENITLVQRPAPGTLLSGDGTEQSVTIFATDESGNVDSCQLTVTLEDSTEPMITCPADQELTADQNCEALIPDYTGDAAASSACDQSNITISQMPAAGTLMSGHNASETITLTATDASGNSVSCSFEVLLLDRTPPVIVSCQSDTTGVLTNACDYTLPDYWSVAPAAAADNCRPTGTMATTATGDQIIYTQTPPPGTVLTDAFTVATITLTADDGNGNTVSCDFDLTLIDTISPTIICPADTIANPDANCDFALEDYRARAQVQDNCTEAGSLTVTQSPAPGTVINGDATSQEITLTVEDASGNVRTCSFNLTLEDNIPPSIDCPADKIEELTASCSFTVPDYTGEALVADNCTDPSTISIAQVPAPGTVLTNQNEGDAFTVTFTADDGNGNTTNCVFTVTLDDVIPPVLSCPADPVIFVDASCGATLPDLVAETSASDNCADATGGSGISITQSPLAGTGYTGDDTEVVVTITADDGNGNQATCLVTVSLQDTISPTITCPMNEVLVTDGNCEVVVPDYRPQTIAMDNCTATGGISISQDIAAGTVLSGDGTSQVVTLTANDGNGNTRSCALEVVLEDRAAPTIECPITQTQFTDNSCTDDLLDYTGQAVVMDNCTAPTAITITQMPAAGFVLSGVGPETVTLTADDGNGNTQSCSFIVNLEDNEAPGIICPPNASIDFGTDCGFTVPDYRALAALSDNCVVTPLTAVQSPAIDTVLSGLGVSQEVTLTVTDNSGNSASCSFTVTTTSPTPPPAQETVILAVVAPPTGTGTVNLLDAFDNAAESNLSNIDLDQMLDPGVGPFSVTFYLSLEDANAEQNAIPAADFDPVVNGEVVLARIEDPASGCFTLSQILLDIRTPGISNAADSSFCSRPGVSLKIDGRPAAGGQGTTIVRHQWRLISGGETGVTETNLMQADQQILMVNTTGLRSGSVVLEYQFFEDYGDGPVVPSVPKQVVVEVLQVGAGDFMWDGN